MLSGLPLPTGRCFGCEDRRVPFEPTADEPVSPVTPRGRLWSAQQPAHTLEALCGYSARMGQGECQHAFGVAAARDGVGLTTRRLHDWLTRRGHLGLPPEASDAIDVLRAMFIELGGDEDHLATRTDGRRLSGDYYYAPTDALVEVDEVQHFTRYRRRVLELYPAGTAHDFDLDQYVNLCDQHWRVAERKFTNQKPEMFPGEHARARQRAYYDALRDLGASAVGHSGVLRAPALEPGVSDWDKGVAAWMAVRHRLVE